MSLHAQIVGGPRDGEIVPHYGPVLRLPVPLRLSYIANPNPERLPTPVAFEVETYDLRRGFDGELYYVRPEAT